MLERAVTDYPDDPEIRLLYGTILVMFRPDDAPWELATAIKLDPNHPGRLTRAASMLFRLGQVDAAQSYVARASQLAPQDFPLAADLLNLGGKIAALREEDDLADESLRSAVHLAPQRPEFALDLAQFLAEHDRRVEAAEVAKRTLASMAPDRSDRDERDVARLEKLLRELEDDIHRSR